MNSVTKICQISTLAIYNVFGHFMQRFLVLVNIFILILAKLNSIGQLWQNLIPLGSFGKT